MSVTFTFQEPVGRSMDVMFIDGQYFRNMKVEAKRKVIKNAGEYVIHKSGFRQV